MERHEIGTPRGPDLPALKIHDDARNAGGARWVRWFADEPSGVLFPIMLQCGTFCSTASQSRKQRLIRPFSWQFSPPSFERRIRF